LDQNKALYERVKNQLNAGHQEQEELLARVSAVVPRDKLVAPTSTFFSTDSNGELRIAYTKEEQERYSIHRHALTQLSQKVRLPVEWTKEQVQLSRAERWRAQLLAYVLQENYQNTKFLDRTGATPRFLHRLVGNELRGFLSRRFNRHIASAPLLRAFVEACTQVGAFPFSAIASDVKVALKCMLPDVFEPVKGQFVCIGVEWANSDFGAGRMQVAMSLWMPTADRFTVLDHILSRVHIGSVIEESDIELSEETALAEAKVQSMAIADSVKTQLSGDSVSKLLKAIEEAHAKDIPWDKLKPFLQGLPKSDVATLEQMLQEGGGAIDLPPVPTNAEGVKTPTKWWASAALSWLASEARDPEKRLDLEHRAGAFLEMK
jgi:hypothetical protein